MTHRPFLDFLEARAAALFRELVEQDHRAALAEDKARVEREREKMALLKAERNLVESLSGRVQALAVANALVRRTFSDAALEEQVDIGEVIAAVLRRPYREPMLSGPAVPLGERAVNNIALVFHELATNAAKYGALSVDGGRVAVEWQVQDGKITFAWKETGGPIITAPGKKRFRLRVGGEHSGRSWWDSRL